MRTLRGGILCLAACLALAGCAKSEKPKPAPAAAPALPEKTPDMFRVNLATSKGAIVIEAHRDWAPNGVDQFYELVRTGYFDGGRFYRVLRDYVAQFGICGDPDLNRLWATSKIRDDAVRQSNTRGRVSFAQAAPNTRTTQIFINLKDNKDLDASGLAPIGEVVSGMDVADRLYFLYGDLPPRGEGPDPAKMAAEGTDYLKAKFPRLDYIRKATIQ